MKRTLSRRQFIRASAATAAGGMLLSFHIPALARATSFEPYADGHAEINAWLTIGSDDVITIRVAQSEMGQGVMTALPMIVAEELEADFRNVRAEYADANRSIRHGRVYQRMMTAGSGAVRLSRPYLQQAGAEARERLVKAAAERWNVSPAECYADYGKIYHRPTRRSINYGAIAADAAKVSVANVAIKSPEAFNLLGLPTRRLDVPAKVDGSAMFSMDVRVPGMRYAAVVHCPVLGGGLRSYRFNAIRNRPGVRQAIRLDNGVAIVADTFWQAKTAADLLPVDWNIGDAGKTFSDRILREFVSQLDQEGSVVVDEGRAVALMDDTEKTIESDYTAPYLSHACMEPLNCTVHVQTGRVDVWAGVQDPEATLNEVAKITGMAPADVYIHNCMLGGGFGRRSNIDFVREAVLIAMEVDVPVQMIWTREEDSRQGAYRPMTAIRFKAGFDLDKNLITYTNHSITPSILEQINPAATASGIDRSSVEGLANMPYAVANKRITHSIRNTHLTSWFWRSVGNSQNAYAMECFVDEMATAAGMDPLAFRRKHLADRPDMLNVLDVLEQKAEWRQAMPAGSAKGLAIHECYGTICAQVAEVTVSEEGDLSVDRIVSVVDCGNLVNPMTAEMQIESGVIFGLTAALYGKLTVENGRILETNFDTYRMVTMNEAPIMETHFALSGGDKWGGLGEPSTPPVAPAICNALYRIIGRRIRSLPIKDYYLRRA
ncbi:MAG: molybdopterin cofactor-binding domain-containing protein [Pseudomonadales bacterium]